MRREGEKDWGESGVSRDSYWHSEAASSPRAMHPLEVHQSFAKCLETDQKSFDVPTEILGFSPTGVEWFSESRIIH